MIGYKHPLERFYSSLDEAEKIARLYFDSKQICSFFIYSKECCGLKMYGIAYNLNSLLDFEYERD